MARKDNEARFFVDIARVDEEERMVYGYGTRGDIKDSYGTIIDSDSVRDCLPDYLLWRNVREMHQPSAVGTAEEVTVDETGVFLGVKVVDDAAWAKVQAGVYKGFSIGGKKSHQDGDRIFLREITEFSLVDRPANGECKIEEFRIHGGGEGMEEGGNETVQRDMYDVRNLAEMVQQLLCLANYAQYEAEQEGDNSPVPAKLRTALVLLVETFKEMAVEEITELMQNLKVPVGVSVETVTAAAEADVTRKKAPPFVKDKDSEDETPKKNKKDGKKEGAEEVEAAATPDLIRAGARNSQKDAEDLQAAHDVLTRLGAACNVEQAASPDVTRLASLESDITRLAGENDVLRAEVERLKAEPVPAKGVTRVVGKGGDVGGVTRQAAELPVTTDPVEAVLRIHATGGTRVERI